MYPSDLISKRVSTKNKISFLGLKLKKNSKQYIGTYNKNRNFDFNANSVTNWYSC